MVSCLAVRCLEIAAEYACDAVRVVPRALPVPPPAAIGRAGLYRAAAPRGLRAQARRRKEEIDDWSSRMVARRRAGSAALALPCADAKRAERFRVKRYLQRPHRQGSTLNTSIAKLRNWRGKSKWE